MLTERQKEIKARAEMNARRLRPRKRAMIRYYLKTAGQVVAIGAGTILFIIMLYGFMLVFPD